jgi:hypothetical protein
MSTALGLAMQISANTAQLATAVQDVNKRLDEMGGAGKRAAQDLSVLKNIEIAKLFIEGIKLVADGLIGAANAARSLFDDSREAIDAIGKLSTQTGVSVEAIQKLQGVARLAGVDSETLAKALGKLGVQADKLKDKDDNVFERLGLDAKELASSDVETVLFQVADAFAAIGSDTEKLGIASELFGERIGRSLVPLLNQGGEALEKALERAGRLGGVLTEDQVRLVERMNDRFSEVSSTITGIINQITASLAGPLEDAATFLLDTFEKVGGQKIGQVIADKLLQFAEVVAKIFLEIVKFLGTFIDDLRTLISKIPGVDIRSEEQKIAQAERQSVEDVLKRDAEARAEIAKILAAIERQQANIDRGPRAETLFGTSVGQSRAEIERLNKALERLGSDVLSDEDAQKLGQRLADIDNGVTAFGTTIDNLSRSVSASLQRARDSLAQANDPGTAVQAAADVVADVDVADIVEATEEQTDTLVESLDELRRDLLGITGQPAEILGGA